MLRLRYLPLAWSAVLLTRLTFFILKELGLDLKENYNLLNISHPWTLALPIYDTYQLMTVALLLILLKKDGIVLKEIGFRGVSVKYYVLALIPLLVVGYIWDFCVLVVNYFGITMLWWGSNDIVAPIKTPIDLLILTVFPVFFCSPLEEILYRGYLLTALTQRLNTILAVLIDSLIFASIHYAYGIGTMLFIFFWNFIPCLLYLKTRSLYPSILFHSANNLLAYVILPLLWG